MSDVTTELPAGRALDAEIATRVMGWTLTGRFPNGEGWRSLGNGFVEAVPHYSEDVAAAFIAVNRLRENGATVLIESMPDGWAVRFSGFTVSTADGRSQSLATAICQAALRSIT